MARFDTLCLTLTIASLSVLGVWPQSPPSPPPCVLSCSDSSAQSASCSSTDVNCICNSNVFANDVVSCVVSNCSATDAAAAAGYFDALCSGATSSSVSLSDTGVPSTGSFSTTTGSTGSVASSSGSTSDSSLSSSQSSHSGLSSSTGQSSVSSTTSGASQSSTGSSTGSSTSASFTTPSSTTPPVSHAVRGHISMSFAGVGFALVLAVALVAW